MATRLYLLNDSMLDGKHAQVGTMRGDGSIKTSMSTAGGTGQVIGTWYTLPLNGVSIGATTITLNLWGNEWPDTDVNAGIRVVISRCDGAGSVISQISASNSTELKYGMTCEVRNWTDTATARTLADGDRIRVQLTTVAAGGTYETAIGHSQSFAYNGPTAGQVGDSWVQFSETITAQDGSRTGAAALTLGAFTLTATGAVKITGAAHLTLGALTVTGEAGLGDPIGPITGAATLTLGAFSLVGAGLVHDVGAVTKTKLLHLPPRKFRLTLPKRSFNLTLPRRSFILHLAPGVEGLESGTMSIEREVTEGVQTQGTGEQIAWKVDTTQAGGSPTSTSCTAYDLTAGRTNVTGSVLTGVTSVSGNQITLPVLSGLTADHRYQLDVQYTTGGNVLIGKVQIQAEN